MNNRIKKYQTSVKRPDQIRYRCPDCGNTIYVDIPANAKAIKVETILCLCNWPYPFQMAVDFGSY